MNYRRKEDIMLDGRTAETDWYVWEIQRPA